MKTLMALRHVDFEDLGELEPFFTQAGVSIQYLDATRASLAGIDPLEADVMVVLGGPMKTRRFRSAATCSRSNFISKCNRPRSIPGSKAIRINWRCSGSRPTRCACTATWSVLMPRIGS